MIESNMFHNATWALIRVIVGISFLVAAGIFSCGTTEQRLAGTKLAPEKVRDGEYASPPAPKIPEGPGKEALLKWVRGCYEQGLTSNPVFAKGGRVVIQWTADRGGDLLQMDFSQDTFRGWAINSKGETLADCVVRHAQESTVRWSQHGTAPIRLEGAANEAMPHTR